MGILDHADCANVPVFSYLPHHDNLKISILCCLHTHWSTVKFLVARLLREDEYFSACIHDRRHEMRRAG